MLNSWFASRPVVVYLIVMAFCGPAARGGSCDVAKSIPSGVKQIANGLVTSQPYSAEFSGSTAVFIKVTNGTIHLTPVTVTIKAGKSAAELCSSSLDIPPQSTVIFTTSSLGDRIYWGIRVDPGDVDVIQLAVIAYTYPAK
jgi:hypothetical protein